MSHINRHLPTTRVLIILSVASILIHLWFGFTSDHGPTMAVFMIAMAAACLPCTVALLRGGTQRNLVMMMVLAAASALVHGSMLVLSEILTGTSAHTHTGHGAETLSVHTEAGAHAKELVLITTLELVVLAVAANLHSRRKTPPASPVSTSPCPTSVSSDVI